MFDRPKPTAGCSANGRRIRRSYSSDMLNFIGIINEVLM